MKIFNNTYKFLFDHKEAVENLAGSEIAKKLAGFIDKTVNQPTANRALDNIVKEAVAELARPKYERELWSKILEHSEGWNRPTFNRSIVEASQHHTWFTFLDTRPLTPDDSPPR
jgi:hypothetical protein